MVVQNTTETIFEYLESLSRKDIAQDYTLGGLFRESHELFRIKSFLPMGEQDQGLRDRATQALDGRLKIIYAELDRREQIYRRVVADNLQPEPAKQGGKWS